MRAQSVPTLVRTSNRVSADEWMDAYVEVEKIGEGESGTVYSGYRVEDLIPASTFTDHTHTHTSAITSDSLLQVAIKHIQTSEMEHHPVASRGFDLSCSVS